MKYLEILACLLPLIGMYCMTLGVLHKVKRHLDDIEKFSEFQKNISAIDASHSPTPPECVE